MADFDLYDDLELLHAQEKQKADEELQWKEKYQVAIGTIEKLQAEKKELNKKIKQLEINFASLFDTARTEIKRKDNQIAELRKERDDVCFRRNVRLVKESGVEKNAGEHRIEGSHFNPFSLDPRNTVSKATDKPVDENIAYPSRRRDGDYERNNRTNNREGVPRSVRGRDRSRNRSRDEFERRGERNSTQRRGSDRDLSQIGSSDSSRETSDMDRNRHSHRSDQRFVKQSNGYPISKQKIHQNNKHPTDKEPNSRSDDCLKSKISSISDKEQNTDKQKAIIEKEILNDVKKLKQMKLSVAENVPEKEADTIKVAAEKSNEFYEALFDDMVMNVGEEPNDLYNDLEAAQPNDDECTVTKVIKKPTEEIFTRTDVNCNVELQVRTPMKKLFEDLFGPSEDVSTSTIVERKNSVSSVGETSSDNGEVKIAKSLNVTVSTLKAFVVDKSKKNNNECKKQEKSKKNCKEVKTKCEPSLPLEITPQNIEISNAVDPAKSCKLFELDSSFYSSEEEEEKEKSTNQTESESDLESPPFENCDVPTVLIEETVSRNKSKNSESDKHSEKSASENNRKPSCEKSESSLQGDGREFRSVIGIEIDKTGCLENPENRNVLPSTLQHADDVEMEHSHKLYNRQKQNSDTSRHSSEKNSRKEENTVKHHHSSKEYSSSSRSKSSSSKESRKSKKSTKSVTEKYDHHHSTKPKHESRRESEREKTSTSHKSSQSSRKYSKDNRQHTSRAIKSKNVTDASQETNQNDSQTQRNHHDSIPPPMINPSLQEVNSSDLKLFQDKENSLHFDISDDEKVDKAIEDKQQTNKEPKMNVVEPESSNNAKEKSSDHDVQSSKSIIDKERKCENMKDDCDSTKTTNDDTVTTINVDELPSDYVDLPSVIVESLESTTSKQNYINGRIESDLVLIESNIEEPFKSTKLDRVELEMKENQSSDGVNTAKLTESRIGEKMTLKTSDSVSLAANVEDQSKTINEQIESISRVQSASNPIESNANVDKLSNCVPIVVESPNIETLDSNGKMDQSHVEPTNLPLLFKSENDKPIAEHLIRQATEIHQKTESQPIDSSDLSAQQKEESIRCGRRKKLKTPRKCTDEGKVAKDFLPVDTITMVSKRYAKSDDEHSSIKKEDPPHSQRRSQSISNLDSPTETKNGDILQMETFCTEQDLTNSKMQTKTLTPERSSISSTEGFDRNEMPVLRVDEKSVEPLSAFMTTCAVPNILTTDSLNNSQKDSANVTTINGEETNKRLSQNVVGLEVENKVQIIENKKLILQSSASSNGEDPTVSCGQDSPETDDGKNHSNLETHRKKDSQPFPVANGEGVATSKTQKKHKRKSNQKVFVYVSNDSGMSKSNQIDKQHKRTSEDISDSYHKDEAASTRCDTDNQPNNALDNSLERETSGTAISISGNNKKPKKHILRNILDSNVTDKSLKRQMIESDVEATSDNKKRNKKKSVPHTVESDSKCSTSAATNDSHDKDKTLQNSDAQDCAISESKESYKNSIGLDVKNNEILPRSDRKDQHEDIVQNSESFDVEVACRKRSLVVSITKVKVPINASVNSFQENIHLDHTSHVKILSTDSCSKKLDTSFPVCSSETVIQEENALKKHVKHAKFSENNDLPCVEPQSVTSSTIDRIESCLNESASGDEKVQQGKIKINPKKKTRKLSSSSSDSGNVRSDKVVFQTKRSKKLQNNNQSPSINGCGNTLSPTISNSSKNQRVTAKRKRTSSRENSLLHATVVTPMHHTIFHDDVLTENQEPPVYNSIEDDVQYQEIDNRMRSMFQSPAYTQTNGGSSFEQTDCTLFESTDSHHLKENLTVEETFNLSQKSQCDTSSSSRKISVGSNDYVIETVGAHTANVFITRKKCRKRVKVAVAIA